MTTAIDISTEATVARGTYIDAVTAAELFVDRSYQRDVDMTQARKLAKNWDRRLAGVIEVSDPDPMDLGAPWCARCVELAGVTPDEIDRFNREWWMR